LNVLLSESPDSQPGISVRIHGGGDAPGRARRSVMSRFRGRLPQAAEVDLGLIISELVTNSVCHANVGAKQTLTVDCVMLADRLRVTVTDPGAEPRPRLRVSDQLVPGGRGLQIVAALSCAWGVGRDPAGTTSVWCDLLLASSPPGPADAGRVIA
jgi:anti-sigma regulatory factor (Ser/Thr protein kinase)